MGCGSVSRVALHPESNRVDRESEHIPEEEVEDKTQTEGFPPVKTKDPNQMENASTFTSNQASEDEEVEDGVKKKINFSQLSLDEIKDLLAKRMAYLNSMDKETFLTVDVPEIKTFNKVYRTLRKRKKTKEDIVTVGDYLAENRFVPLFEKLNSWPDKENYYKNPLYANINEIKKIIWNYSDSSVLLCQKISSSQIIPTYLSQLNEQEMIGFKESESDSSKKYWIVRANLGVIMNCLRNNKVEARKVFRKSDGITIILKYVNNSYLVVKTNALITLAYAADQDETEVLKATGTNIKFIIEKILDPALKQPNHVGKRYAFSVEEILEGLSLMARQDKNAEAIVAENGLEKIEQVLTAPFTDGETEYAFQLLYALCFSETNKASILKNKKLMDIIRSSTPLPSTVARCRNGIVFELLGQSNKIEDGDDEKVEDENAAVEDTRRHVMISYNWDHQKIALKLKSTLEEYGISTWMDVERMEGDILEKMADAVETASAIIVCLSTAYKDSSACRTEATYAFKLKKTIVPVLVESGFTATGWLGALVGMKLYYSLHDDQLYETEMQKVISFIEERKGKPSAVSNHIDAITSPESQCQPPRTQSHLHWSEMEVEKWFKTIVPSLDTSLVEGLDGRMLDELTLWQKNAPDFFLNFLKNDLKITHPADMIRFSATLRNL